jgi:hypothetical protein
LDNLGNFKKGVPHGYFRYFDVSGDLEFFGCFVRGIGHGVCWKGSSSVKTTFRNILYIVQIIKRFLHFLGLAGGGFLVSPSWDFTSNSTMYLYPDCRYSSLAMVEKSYYSSKVGNPVTSFANR